MAPARGRSGDGAGPSAHPISQPSTATAADAEEAGAGCSTKLPGVADEDASLYLDLLRKARGDTALAGKWLEQISSTAPTGGDESGRSSENASAPPLSPSSHQQPRNPNLDLDAAAAAAGAPASFFCPISLKIMRDPVTLSTGQSYDRPFIARWLAGGSATCPATGQALALPASQVPNVALRKATEDWAERHALWLLGPDGHVKPIPAGDDFSAAGVVRSYSNSGGGGGGIDEALRLQAEALERHQRGHREGGGGGGTQGSPPSAPPLQGIPCNGGGGGFGGGGGAPPSSSQQGGAFYPPYYPRPLPPPGHPPLPLRPLDHAQSACTLALSSPRLLSLALSLCSGATLALFGVSLWKNGWEVAPLRTNPLIGASPAVLLQLGAKDGASIVDGGQWWRLLSSAFACAGALDAAVVSSLGWTLGFRAVARSVVTPAVSVPLIYVSSSAFGALVSVNALPKQPTPSVGAPAGCAGLLGAAAALQLLHWRRFSRRLGTLVALVGVGGVLAALAVLPLNDCFYIGGGAAFGALSAPVLANSEGGGGGGGAAAAAAAAARRQRRRRNTNEGNANNSGEVVGGPPFSAAAFFSALFRLLLLCSLAGALAAGVLGVTKYRAALGDRLCGDKCARAACVETRWWSCDSGVGGPGPAAPAPPAPPATGGATPACSATLEGDSTKVTCASTTKGASKGETKTLKGTRPTSGAGLIAVCREACLGGGGDPPAAAAPEKPVQKVTPVPPKDGVAADPSKGVLI